MMNFLRSIVNHINIPRVILLLRVEALLLFAYISSDPIKVTKETVIKDVKIVSKTLNNVAASNYTLE
ncbi:hypothetical protein IFN73_10000 [Francisella tularensis subsp. holarctica]|nr:hypothetical protein [Francisella tularensis subsp. holarctica]